MAFLTLPDLIILIEPIIGLYNANVLSTPSPNEILRTVNDETFEKGLLEYPQYTKPQIWEGKSVPEVLLSGDHAKIKDWRLLQSEDITRRRRPDLWKKYKKIK